MAACDHKQQHGFKQYFCLLYFVRTDDRNLNQPELSGLRLRYTFYGRVPNDRTSPLSDFTAH